MTADGPVHPPADAWVAAIHAAETDLAPVGTAVVIDTDRLLTCAHVVMSSDSLIRQPLWVSFPKADDCPRRLVASVIPAYSPPVRDLAVLVLDEPVPTGVEAAPLRCPKPADLVSNAWWAFGFPDHDPIGDSAYGVVGASLALGWVRLDTQSRYLVRPGFSGGGLWSPDYNAVIGVVGQAHGNGDGRAITLHQADLYFPDLKLALLASWSAQEAGEVALQQWGWTLARDPEGVRHWRPRARGVSIESERGYRFRGRTSALIQIVQWLDRPAPDRRVLVVTGSPGAGKSAVLGRIVTTADAAICRSLPPEDKAVRATLGSVACAVHAKGKTALEVAEEIARAASARLPGEPKELAPAIRDALSERVVRPFNVIIDALDEATTPEQARVIVDQLVLPLAETCAHVGVQVIVGTRRRDDGGNLLDRFGAALAELDLDDSKYFAHEDLVAYALASLQLADDERTSNPYADDALATPLASRIAEMSGQNFLVAGLVARSHGLHDKEATDSRQLAFTATVDSAIAGYLQSLSPVAGVPASRVFTALAFAEAPGLPVDLWQVAIEAIGGTRISREDLMQFVRSSAANFLVEADETVASGHDGRTLVYRLFHQALNDALLRTRSDVTPRADDERAVTLALTRYGRLSSWNDAPNYLLRSLPRHADAAGLIDNLLCDDAYLLHADLRRLIQVADKADSARGHGRAQLLGLTPRAVTAGPRNRAALFSVTEALDNLGASYRVSSWQAPYRALWACTEPRSERAILEGHEGAVRAICAVAVVGRELLASGGDDRTVRIWDPQTGEQRAALTGHLGAVRAVCSVSVKGRELLASGGEDGTVRIWDLESMFQPANLEGYRDLIEAVRPAVLLEAHTGWVEAVCSISVARQELLATGGGDGTLRIWDPQNGERRAVLADHGDHGWARTVCTVMVAGRKLLASGANDGMVRIWDPQSGEQRALLEGHRDGVQAMCSLSAGSSELLASGGGDGMVRIWDPESGEQRAVLEGHRGRVEAVCPIAVRGQELLASGAADRTVRIWDPQSGEQRAVLESHRGRVEAVCSIAVRGQELLASGHSDGTLRIWNLPGRERRAISEKRGYRRGARALCSLSVEGGELLASGGGDGMVRIWNPQTGEQQAVLAGHHGVVRTVCSVATADRELLASGGDDGTVQIWNPQTGEQQAVLAGHHGVVRTVCSVATAGRELLASGGDDGTVQIWDSRTGDEHAVLAGHRDAVQAVCSLHAPRGELLASGADDRTVRIWDPQSGEQRAVLQGHLGRVEAVCSVAVGGRELLASGGDDETVRIWDTQTLEPTLTIPTHHAALAIEQTTESLAIGLTAGILVVEVNLAM